MQCSPSKITGRLALRNTLYGGWPHCHCYGRLACCLWRIHARIAAGHQAGYLENPCITSSCLGLIFRLHALAQDAFPNASC